MALPSPLRALCEHKPDRARKVIRAALTATSGHRGKAASRLAASAQRWIPAEDSYRHLWRCVVALGMGEEIAREWPVAKTSRAAETTRERTR